MFGYGLGAWLILIAAIDLSNVIGHLQADPDISLAEPVLWEYSSWFSFLFLSWMPWLAYCFAAPARQTYWPRYLVHPLVAVVWAVAHVALFLLIRVVFYAAVWNMHYRYARNPLEFFYELPKDAMAYTLLIAAFSAAAAILAQREAVPARVSFDIRDGAKLLRVPLADILAVTAAGNYVEFVLADGRRPLMRSPLAALEAELSGLGFIRTHRSWLINATAVTALSPEGSGDYTVTLGALDVPLSRRYREALSKLRAA